MAGIYIHIPFCKTRCIYCDFFTGTELQYSDVYTETVCKEIEIRAEYLEHETVDTIYFGGGTPSVLSERHLKTILECIRDYFIINDAAEITLEANPDDLNNEYLSVLTKLGFNRLSIGIQSFDNELLHFLNRRHSAEKAIQAVELSRKHGFSNISIDLMYGLPGQTLQLWRDSLNKAVGLGVQHISSYHLIYEENTLLYNMLKNNGVSQIDEDLSVEMFSLMIELLTGAGFTHYEISNFAKEGFFSRHNTSYWLNKKYLGLGPSAHSYNGIMRCWNIASLQKYIDGIQTGEPCSEIEFLDKKARYNDFILTGMRTMWGINEGKLIHFFGQDLLFYFRKNIQKYIESKKVIYSDGTYKLSKEGIFISDSIMSDLMYV